MLQEYAELTTKRQKLEEGLKKYSSVAPERVAEQRKTVEVAAEACNRWLDNSQQLMKFARKVNPGCEDALKEYWYGPSAS